MAAFLLAVPALCQQTATDTDPTDGSQPKHILLLIPNFRTSAMLANYTPLTPSQKFKIAKLDSFDRGTFALAMVFAGESFLAKADPTFGQGIGGYAHYVGTAYADFVIGNYMTEGVFPTILHQDPRYFRKGKGKALSRLGYAAGQIFWTHNDSGRGQFNYSEVLGNSSAVAISMAYYPGNRDAKDAVYSLTSQLAVDMAANILKEFWPGGSGKKMPKSEAAADSASH